MVLPDSPEAIGWVALTFWDLVGLVVSKCVDHHEEVLGALETPGQNLAHDIYRKTSHTVGKQPHPYHTHTHTHTHTSSLA